MFVTLSDMANFGRGKDKQQRKRRSYLGVVGHDAGVGAKIGAGLGALGATAQSAALLGTKSGRSMLRSHMDSLGVKGGLKRKAIIAGGLAAGTGLSTLSNAALGGLLGAGVGAVRAPLRKKEQR